MTRTHNGVQVIAWGASECLAIVRGVRVRLRRYSRCDRWLCDECGVFEGVPGCTHIRDVQRAPLPAGRYRPGPPNADHPRTTRKERQ